LIGVSTVVPSGGTNGAPASLSHRQILTVIGGLMVGLFIAALDQTIVSTALPRVVSDLGGFDKLSWVIVAYLLTSTAATPLWGKVGDLYGRRGVFQASIVVFVVGSLACGLSPDMNVLILSRGLQGIGGGGLFALSFAIVGDIISPRQRGRYMGYFTAVFASAGVIGPLVGGFITDHFGWRWIFTINVPIGIVALVVTSMALRLPFPRRKARVDVAGGVLVVAGVTCLVLVTVWGGDRYPWASRQILLLAAAGVALFALFVLWESRVEEPIVPLRLFGNPVARMTFLLSFLLGPMMYSTSAYLPLFLQGVGSYSATTSGLLLAPNMAGLTVTSIVTGRITARTGRYKLWVVLGSAFMTADMLLLSRLGVSTSSLFVMALMVLVGAAMGLAMPVLSTATQNAVELRDLGVATSTLTFCRTRGASFGVAAHRAGLNTNLDAPHDVIGRTMTLPEGITARNLANKPSSIHELAQPVRGLVQAALAHGVTSAFLAAVPLAAVATLLSLRLRELPLRDFATVTTTEREEADALSVPGGAVAH
jgi:EmrB/QacA subfamily drug resistance transporter